jgi:hypothetical protein
MDELRQLLNDWDPIGVRDISAHDDEYDCLLGPLMTMLAAGGDVPEVTAYLRMQVEDHVGLNPDGVDVGNFAARAVVWWRTDTTGAA